MTVILTNLVVALILLTLTAAVFFIPRFLLKRAVGQVIHILRARHSFCWENAKTAEELGLHHRPLFDRLLRPKDYKPYALDALVESGIVRMAEDGRVCLEEAKLAELHLNDEERSGGKQHWLSPFFDSFKRGEL